MLLTPKQIELLSIVTKKNDDGSLTDLDEILERLSYKPTKDAVHFTIRSLIKHELIEKVGMEKRRDRKRVLIGATPLCEHYANAYRGFGAAVILEPSVSEDDLGSLGSETSNANI